MKEKLAIIGAGIENDFVGKTISHLEHENVIVIDTENEDVKEQIIPFNREPYIIRKAPEFKNVYGGKEFVCKGRHEYRLVDIVKKDTGEGVLVTEIWKCQCGRVLES